MFPNFPTLQAEDILSAFPLPSVLTDEQGRCLAHNDATSGVLFGRGLARLVVGRMRFQDLRAQVQWETALHGASATGAPTSAVLEFDSAALELQLAPVRSPLDREFKPLLAVFAERGLRPDPERSLQPKGRLTQAEREVLSAMLRGLPAKAIAAERGASVNTVRAQIVSILDKTGHASQRELLAAYGESSFGQSIFGATQQQRGA